MKIIAHKFGVPFIYLSACVLSNSNALAQSENHTVSTLAEISSNSRSNEHLNKMDCIIEPYMEVNVASSESGVIKEILVERGDIVEKGQVLARLESGVQDANARHAAAKLNHHEKYYNRLQTLYEQNVIAYDELEQAKTELELARHELQRADELLRLRTIRSPMSGIVVDKYISPGELTEQHKVLKIAQLDYLKVQIIAPLNTYETAEPGLVADVWPEGPASGPFKAEIDIVDKVIDAASGTFGISMLMENPGYKIPAGVRCLASLIPGSKGRLHIVRSATAKRNKDTHVRDDNYLIKTSINSSVDMRINHVTNTAINILPKKRHEPKIIPAYPTAAELQDLVTQFISAYEDGNLKQFNTLFDLSIKTNDHNNYNGIIEDYGKLFSHTEDRQLFINSIKWTYSKNEAKGIGKLSAVVLTKNKGVRVLQGKIQLVAEKSDHNVLFTHLYHYDVNLK